MSFDPLGNACKAVHDLGSRSGVDGTSARAALHRGPAGGSTAAGHQQAEVVVDFGRGRDRRSGIVPAASLLDRDRGWKSLDGFDIRLAELGQELPRVRAERFHVFPLAFGEDGVEGE